MKNIDILRIAMSTFIHNKMRTLLTIFGVAVGVGTIAFLLSLGYGLQKITIGEIVNLKALKAINIVSGNSSILDLNDEAKENINNINHVTSIDPNLNASGQLSYNNTRTDIVGNIVSARYVDLESLRYETGGRYENDHDNSIVISSSVSDALSLSAGDIMDKKIKVYLNLPNPNNEKEPILTENEYTVVGVIKDASASYAYIPFETITIPHNSVYNILKVDTNDSSSVAAVKDEINKMGFKATSLGDKVDQINQFFRIVNIALLAVGAVALFVASIGMFNTLTVSLLERTRDIGIMKSVGATDKQVYSIFLAESSLIAFIGGMTGIIGAVVSGSLLNVVISIIASRAGGESVALFQTPLMFIISIFIASAIVGIVTGIYPARRAAKLNPLDALRYE